jgi:hypothetical protein
MPLLAAAPAAPAETVVLLADVPVQYDVDLPEGTPRGGAVLRDHGQTVETAALFPALPDNQRSARRITATVTLRPAPPEPGPDGRLVPGDAWTRAGTLSVVLPGTAGAPDREVELMRFVTGFGGAGTFRQDLTCLAPLLHGRKTIRLYVSTYTKPGWIAGATLEYSAEGAGYRRPAFAEPVLNEPQVTGREPHVSGSVVIPPSLARPRLRVLSTGHSTEGKPDHEFISCPNILRIDGREIARWRPWAEQGGSVRGLNPMAGRQTIDGRDLWSSDLDRSGWHPGLVVEPLFIPVPELTAGRHEVEIEIQGIRPKGASEAFGYWRVSAVVVADEPWPAAPAPPR